MVRVPPCVVGETALHSKSSSDELLSSLFIWKSLCWLPPPPASAHKVSQRDKLSGEALQEEKAFEGNAQGGAAEAAQGDNGHAGRAYWGKEGADGTGTPPVAPLAPFSWRVMVDSLSGTAASMTGPGLSAASMAAVQTGAVSEPIFGMTMGLYSSASPLVACQVCYLPSASPLVAVHPIPCLLSDVPCVLPIAPCCWPLLISAKVSRMHSYG